MALLLKTTNLAKAYGPRTLFRGISISFDDGERTGLIGPNGAGKSTLLKILAGIEAPDEGEIETRRNLLLGYVPQDDVFPPGETVEHVVLSAVGEVRQVQDAHDLHTEVAILLSKIGFDRFDQPADELSGGWRKRLSIARQLIRKPDLLLLDEPTNHLDLEGIEWLEQFLRDASFAYIICSHDRYFLENTANRVVELSRSYADGYLSTAGTYSDFVEKREQYLDAQAAREQAVASRVRREVEWLKRGAKARTTKAKGRIEAAGRLMNELADLKQRNNAGGKAAGIDFNASGRQTRKLLTVEGVGKAYAGRTLFEGVDVVLTPGQRLGLVGPNGSGKSTLIKLLAGHVPPDGGTVKPADGLQIVLFDQNREQLDKSLPLRKALSPTGGDTVTFQGQGMHVSGWARRFLFRTEQLDVPVGDLSGGERARVLIARLMLRPADLLVLDEPTNDLDIASLEVLEESLLEFPGAVLLVTHDRYLLDRVCTEVLGLLGDGRWRTFADYQQYDRAKADLAAEREQRAKAEAAKQRPAAAATPQAARKPRLSYMEQRELEGIEQKIADAEARLADEQNRLADPNVLADWQRMADASAGVAKAQEQVATLYARWEVLEAKRG
ncbi:MAG TPA: ABC-F family ATP-binding cassette domain-containing protein [Tepidisphaeraceae bacterium]|nr:ABC-F family ATP-binding cassette domain-containing protein [Tepidisphaeraceae bacterium]